MLWDIDRREQKITKGASRIKSFKNISALLHAASGHHSHHVSVLRARRHRHSRCLRCHQNHRHRRHHRPQPGRSMPCKQGEDLAISSFASSCLINPNINYKKLDFCTYFNLFWICFCRLQLLNMDLSLFFISSCSCMHGCRFFFGLHKVLSFGRDYILWCIVIFYSKPISNQRNFF